MNELVDWLRAQLDEDERVAEAAIRAHEKAVADFKRGRPSDFEDLPGETAADWFGGTNEDDRGRFWCGLWAGDGIVSIACMDSEYDTDTAEHIARHDPARVLREVAAKRAIVDEHEHRPASPYVKMYPDRGEQPFGCRLCADNDGLIWPAGWCRTLRLLASAYEDRPGYDESWRP